MTIKLRALSMAALFLVASGAAASANTVELTLTVPLKITVPAGAKAIGPDGLLKPFDTNCVVGSKLGYATGAGAQGTIVGQGSTAISGSQKYQAADGSLSPSPTSTVVITYDDGSNNANAKGAGSPTSAVSSYLCWVAWKTPNPSLAPIFVQGNLP